MGKLVFSIRALCVMTFIICTQVGCSSEEKNNTQDCTKPLFDCLAAQGDCVLSSSNDGSVSVQWENGASVSGPIGLAVFDALGPDGQSCFSRKMEGNDIILTSAGDTFRITVGPSGDVSVTCADGSIQNYEAGQGPSGEVGVDGQRLTHCRISGICSRDEDCSTAHVCCSGQCYEGERCPGTCEVDEHCGTGNICCDGLCTSLPSCQMVCSNDLQCDDGVFCNGRERCSGGSCLVPSFLECDDSVACTDDSCDEENKSCSNEPNDSLCGADQRCNPEKGCEDIVSCDSDTDCDDGDECTLDRCQSGICENNPVDNCCHLDSDCDDGDYCNGEEKCDSGSCVAGARPDCDDHVECTSDECDVARNACVHSSDPSKCETDETCDPDLGCVSSNECTDDSEPNDSLQTATHLDNQSTLPATICPGDHDWFVYGFSSDSLIMTLISADTDMGNISVEMLCCDGSAPDESLSHPEYGTYVLQCLGCSSGEQAQIHVFGPTPDAMVDYGLVVVSK